jgi:endonuclease YncB( thermonuclease family)
MKDPKITKPVGVNKDGYASGGVQIEVPSQNLQLDPRSKTSIRGQNYVAQGDTVTVKGTKTRKPVKATWY